MTDDRQDIFSMLISDFVVLPSLYTFLIALSLSYQLT